jgi:thiosulfate dehydrogenase
MKIRPHLILSVFVLGIFLSYCSIESSPGDQQISSTKDPDITSEEIWEAPDTSAIPFDDFGRAVRYGRDLILNTAYYLGPDGIVSHNLGNKMNCTNCHLEAGTKPFAFNFLSSHARYPQYRSRENKILSLSERVNNCIERPHSGKPLKLDGKEMTAIICYIKWLGQNVPVNHHVEGDAPLKLELMQRAADPVRGEAIYSRECKSCHGANGEGQMRPDEICYEYPPLWGTKGYQSGSSMHRVVKAASFIYANMPNKNSNYLNPKLTAEEAFDVAAFMNDDRIHKRPSHKGFLNYPNAGTKPLDYGEAPFADTFPALQHKFGPWKPIIDYRHARQLHEDF